MIRMTAESKSSLSWSISSMICAWIVTSSAVVGSSAIRTSGLHDSAIAIIARWRIPPENWCGIVVDARLGVRDPDLAQQLDRTLARSAACRHVSWAWIASHDLGADRVDGVQRRHRILEDHRDLVAAEVLQLALVHLQQVAALVEHLAFEARVRVAREPEERHRGDALARAGLADDPQHLAALQLEADAVDGLDDSVLGGELDLQVLDLDQALGHLGGPDPRVEPRVEQVDEHAEEDDEEGAVDRARP